MPPTRLTCGERIGSVHRGNAKLFYEKRHEANGELDLALAQLATCGLLVTDRHPICGYRRVVDAERARPQATLEHGEPVDPRTMEPVEYRTDGEEPRVQPVFFGDRVILQYEGVPPTA